MSMFSTTYKMMGSDKDTSSSKKGRSGQKWTTEEDQQLMDEIKEGMSYYDIASSHNRTETAVKMRAITNAIASAENEFDIDELASSISLPSSVIEEFLKNKQEWKDKKKNDNEKNEKNNEKNEKKSVESDIHVLIKFKMFLKKKGKFSNDLDELFDEFMCL